MLFLALFFMLIIFLLLLIIPLLKKILNDYALTLECGSEKLKEEKANSIQQAMDQTIAQRWLKLENIFIPCKKQAPSSGNATEVIQSLQIHLQTILKIFKSEESST